jgi:hypothetical protein
VVIVYLTESSDPLAAKLAEELTSAHGIVAVPVRADFTTAEGVQKIIAEAKAKVPVNPKVGKFQVDILVHSAALFHAMPLEACNQEDFLKVYAINVWGPINLTQAVKPYLPNDRSGRIVSCHLALGSLWFCTSLHYDICCLSSYPILDDPGRTGKPFTRDVTPTENGDPQFSLSLPTSAKYIIKQ